MKQPRGTLASVGNAASTYHDLKTLVEALRYKQEGRGFDSR